MTDKEVIFRSKVPERLVTTMGIFYFCPHCGKLVEAPTSCKKCGQIIDWSKK